MRSIFLEHHIYLISPLFSFCSLPPSNIPPFPSSFSPTLLLFCTIPPFSSVRHLHPVYCVTSPAKDERYRAPPPTPPGYQGLALGDLSPADGVVGGPGGAPSRPPHLRPPDYSVALQRSKLLQSPGAAGSLAEARRLAANLQQQEARKAGAMQGHSRPPSICLQAQELADSEDGMYFLASKLKFL